MKDKVEMTQDLINQLHKDGWLSKKLKQEYELNHLGDDFNYQELLIVCKDLQDVKELVSDRLGISFNWYLDLKDNEDNTVIRGGY